MHTLLQKKIKSRKKNKYLTLKIKKQQFHINIAKLQVIVYTWNNL